MGHTISDIAKLTIGVLNTDINTLATTLQTALRGGGSFGLANNDKIIEVIITRRDENNNCQVVLVWEDQ